jgi:hypothetical protein
MKKGKKTLCICFISLWMGFVMALPALAGSPKPPVSQLLPDLVVSLKLVTKKYVNYKGVTCYSVMPEYTVTNKGQATAKTFQIKIYRKAQGKAFENWSTSGSPTLKPGKSWTHKASAVDENVWCADKTGEVGYRVVADAPNKVIETNENNNTAMKQFPWFKIRQTR